MRLPSSRARIACAFAAVIGVGVVACGGAVFEAGSPLSDDGGGPPVDGGGPPVDGDAGVVPPSPDGARPDDAGGGGGADAIGPIPPGGDGGDAAAPFSCATQSASTTLFCADFDHVATVSTGWYAPLTHGGGALAFDTTNYRSPPNGCATSTPSAITQATFAALEQILTTQASTDFAFSAYLTKIDSAAGAPSTALASVAIGDSTAPLTIALVLSGNDLALTQTTTLADGGTMTQSDPVGTFALTTWSRFQIDVDRTVTPWSITLRRDSVARVTVAAVATPSDATLTVTLGIILVEPPSGGLGATFDDVIVQTL